MELDNSRNHSDASRHDGFWTSGEETGDSLRVETTSPTSIFPKAAAFRSLSVTTQKILLSDFLDFTMYPWNQEEYNPEKLFFPRNMDFKRQPSDSTFTQHTYPWHAAEQICEDPFLSSSTLATQADIKYLTNKMPSIQQSVLPHVLHETPASSLKNDFSQQLDTANSEAGMMAPFISNPAMWEENFPFRDEIETLPTTPASSISSDEPEQDSLSQGKRATVLGDAALSGEDKEERSTTEEETRDKLTEDRLEQATTAAKEKSKAPSKRRKNKFLSPRFAIKTRSKVDIIDDGYKWRKYGKKVVKNSPYHRSYYRCTDKHCLVKKRVERYALDAEYVMTTYEGSHKHPSPTPIQVVYQPVCLSDAFPSTDVHMQIPALPSLQELWPCLSIGRA